jgi:heterodisulfide reductase subunit B
MQYLYYPGCSLESSAKSYDISTRWVFKRLGHELTELEDWNCCGATMYMSIKETVSLIISARNLALAEKMKRDIVAPCSSCYTILNKTNKILKENFILKAKVDQSLSRAGLKYNLTVNVRHPLDVLVNDIGLETISSKVKSKLDGLRIAHYYGCQIVRPDGHFDDRENPVTMDRLFEKLGAESVYFPMKVRCCGGMLMTTFENISLKLCREILECAREHGADCIITTCPLCQMNLEAYQHKVNKTFKTDFRVPILFFTQLLALSLGADRTDTGLDYNLIPFDGKMIGGLV